MSENGKSGNSQRLTIILTIITAIIAPVILLIAKDVIDSNRQIANAQLTDTAIARAASTQTAVAFLALTGTAQAPTQAPSSTFTATLVFTNTPTITPTSTSVPPTETPNITATASFIPPSATVAPAATALNANYPCDGVIEGFSGRLNQVHLSPDASSLLTQPVDRGSTVQILQKAHDFGSDWYEIKYQSDHTGWIEDDFITTSNSCP